MGNKHAKSSTQNVNLNESSTRFSLKRRHNNMSKSTSTMNLSSNSNSNNTNRLTQLNSSPLNTNKWRQSVVNGHNERLKQLNASPISGLKSNHPNAANVNRVIDLNRQMKSNQQNLTNAIKKIDSNQKPSYTNSKLYKPDSILLNNNNSSSNRPTVRHQQHELLNKNTILAKKQPPTQTQTQIQTHPQPQEANPPTHKNNSIFSHSRLLQALQSQLNLFTNSIRMNRINGEYSDDDDDEEKNNNIFRNKRQNNRTETTATFLSTSLQRNSLRYASRRKYKTQSLANPYRHAQTNYPVYIHEALFMPEFSVKGQVTEADFEILDVISRGAFGHVIKVKKKLNKEENGVGGGNAAIDDNQIYAMKIMWKSQVIRDRALQQVKDEVTIAMSCVDNPLIVKTWFYWQSKRFLYIITDYVENGELLSLWLKVHHFPERLVTLYAVEMCLILDYLHKRGIIYRDIKMENILLDQRGHVQLIDFGLSKWLNLGQRTGTICGTIQYMAPEILSVEPYDHSVDWWSLGILIYALLSGEYPLNAAKDHIQMNEKVSKHIFELDQSKGRYTPHACDLVRKLLRKNPQRRLKSLQEIKQEPFFQKEVNRFIDMCLEQEKQQKALNRKRHCKNNSSIIESDTDDEEDDFNSNSSRSSETNSLNESDKKKMISENFWNPYVIIQNYSPLQMLFDEIYAMKQKQKMLKQQQQQQQEKFILSNENNAQLIDESQHSPQSQLPPPPPPPPPAVVDVAVVVAVGAEASVQHQQNVCEKKIKLIKANNIKKSSICSSSNSTTMTTSTPSTSNNDEYDEYNNNTTEEASNANNYLIDEVIIVEETTATSDRENNGDDEDEEEEEEEEEEEFDLSQENDYNDETDESYSHDDEADSIISASNVQIGKSQPNQIDLNNSNNNKQKKNDDFSDF